MKTTYYVQDFENSSQFLKFCGKVIARVKADSIDSFEFFVDVKPIGHITFRYEPLDVSGDIIDRIIQEVFE